ncbi:MAG: complex I NDUFA9 subunit family protein [Pseudomonadota bacterium]
MTQPAPLAAIFGGSGFVGRYVTQRMARRGWRVRVAVRRPNEANFVRPYGDVGQVEPVQANLRDGPSTAKACEGATAVINCVGILAEAGPQKFDSVQAKGAERAAMAANAAGAERFVQISAIGADAASDSLYAQSKAGGEAAVLARFPDAAILRPSIVFGTEDQFFNRFAAMSRFTPVLPVVGAGTRFQPVHVEDVAEAAALCAVGEAPGGVYELGGPRVATFRELMELMLETIRRRRLIADLPLKVANVQAKALTTLERLSAGLWRNDLLTEDQIKLLGRDNVVGEGVKTFADLGIEPKAMEAVLETYLWAHRPGGQYARITESAKKLRG